MGEVYRARDTKLGRDVAIKVLPEAFADDPERIARFQREAKTLAALNHPHIATIHGLEEANGAHFLVMELVEGPTLAERIRRPEGLRLPGDGSGRPSGLPMDEALSIARQVADALQAAHEKGIIHRDLKPANIGFSAEGQVKVFDFGLPKFVDGFGDDEGRAPAAGSPDAASMATRSPSLSLAATRAGVILGTAAYMAPEQAIGRPTCSRRSGRCCDAVWRRTAGSGLPTSRRRSSSWTRWGRLQMADPPEST